MLCSSNKHVTHKPLR